MTHADYTVWVQRLAQQPERTPPPRTRVRTWEEIRASLPALPRLP